MERAILVRHAESEASLAGLMNGDPSRPIPLTERGRSQARELGVRLADDRIDLCVVTEFPRTRETADLALAGRDVPRVVAPELNDPLGGDLEGEPILAFRAWFSANGATTPVPGGGESRVETTRRYAAGFRTVAARPEPSILVVAHGLPIIYALLAARGEDLPLTLENAQVEPAVPHELAAADLDHAIEGLEAWIADREAVA